MERILVINPGATSTKFAVFDGETAILKQTVEHYGDELHQFGVVYDQFPYRLQLIREALAAAAININTLNAVVGRGGLLKPLNGGTYAVNAQMVDDMKQAQRGEHASNLGPVISYHLARELSIPAFIVDPVSVDELVPEARISGMPDLERVSLSHALNMKAVARKAAADMGRSYRDVNFVVVHLGTGVSVSAHQGGKMIDANNSKDEGPFSPDRCGGLPASQLAKLCFSGIYTYEELKERLFGSGGFYAYLGTKDLRQIEKMADDGHEQAALLLKAFPYQVAKEIGAMAAVLEGQVDRIVLTGGMAYSRRLVDAITKRVRFIGPIAVIPGEEELEALATGALRVLRGEEQPLIYQ